MKIIMQLSLALQKYSDPSQLPEVRLIRQKALHLQLNNVNVHYAVIIVYLTTT